MKIASIDDEGASPPPPPPPVSPLALTQTDTRTDGRRTKSFANEHRSSRRFNMQERGIRLVIIRGIFSGNNSRNYFSYRFPYGHASFNHNDV